jgi:hypothetical protein
LDLRAGGSSGIVVPVLQHYEGQQGDPPAGSAAGTPVQVHEEFAREDVLALPGFFASCTGVFSTWRKASRGFWDTTVAAVTTAECHP